MSNQPVGEHGPGGFTRDRMTILAYGMAIAFGYAVAAMGPAMPLLREDLDISRTVGGLHFTALATGAVIAGFVADRLAQAWGRRRVLWWGAAGVATGSALIGSGWHSAVTLPGALLVGSAGSATLIAAQAALSDRHPTHRPVVLTEINTAMSVGSVVPALFIGALVAFGVGWRPAFFAPVAIVVVLLIRFRTETLPRAAQIETTGARRRLPTAYWYYWAAFIPSVGTEWSIGAWGADYLVDVAGTSEGSAAFLMTAFFGAMLGGRLLGGKVAGVVNPFSLLLGTTVVGLAGILLFWGTTSVLPVMGALLIAGLGISMQFPMLLTMAIGTAADRAEVAAARVSIAAGGSVIVAPLTLGAVADQVGIRSAFGMVPGLFLLVVVFAALGRRADRAGRSVSSSKS